MSSADRFSQIYLARGEPTDDSARFRRRLWAFLNGLVNDWKQVMQLGDRIEVETGATIEKRPPYYYLEPHFMSAPVRDVLDSISVVYRHLLEGDRKRGYFPPYGEATKWHAHVMVAAAEENLAYRPDTSCVMRFHVDEQFSRERASTLAVLDDPGMANAKASFEQAHKHLDEGDRHDAIWRVFMTAEALAKEICPQCRLLGTAMLKDHLKPACMTLLGGDQTEQKVWEGMFDGYSSWIDSLHSYRHAQRGPAPVQPSIELTIHVFATGSAFVRTLAVCLRRKLAAQPPSPP